MGVDKQPCGPIAFQVDVDDDNAPRNILEEIVWSKSSEIEKWRLLVSPVQMRARAMQVRSPLLAAMRRQPPQILPCDHICSSSFGSCSCVCHASIIVCSSTGKNTEGLEVAHEPAIALIEFALAHPIWFNRGLTLLQAPPPRDFKAAILSKLEEYGKPGLIAEVKKASPSRGIIQPDFDPVKIAAGYEAGGAACLSVLTDQKYFQGSFENLTAIRSAGNTCPLLCKEFIVDAYQIMKVCYHTSLPGLHATPSAHAWIPTPAAAPTFTKVQATASQSACCALPGSTGV